jgi:transcriptional regulator with XRE-family HTH domain
MSGKRPKRIIRPGMSRTPGPIDKYFGERLRARRTMLKMSQEELGRRLGVSFQQIQKYENGTNRISAALMVTMAQSLGVGIGYFYDKIPKKK